ncbi:MAG TPA: hypothetical protein VGO57_03930 [Verrucomicrobiae bacterium]
MEPFEDRLRQQPLKAIPTDWRAKILTTAQANRPAPRAFWLSTINQQLSTIFWPHPKAWAALATVWIFILFLNFSIREKSPVVAEKYSPPSPEVMVELRQQKLLFAELIGSTQTHDADRKNFFTKPRSQRVNVLVG